MTFRLFSNELRDGGTLSSAHAAQGDNRSPHLAWEGVPEAAKSLVLTMYDPDAPTGSGFWHWVVVDIPSHARELRAGVDALHLPSGARQTRTDAGAPGYVGAAPPPGAPHRYVFTLHAVSLASLPVPDDASGAMVGFVTNMNKVGEASFTVAFGT